MLNLIQTKISDLLDDETTYGEIYKSYLMSLQDDLIKYELSRMSLVVQPTVRQIPKILQEEFIKLQNLTGAKI